jgi:hypothetical protein
MDQPLVAQPVSKSGVTTVLAFLRKDATRPPTTTEMMEFWRVLTQEEKDRFTSEATALMVA